MDKELNKIGAIKRSIGEALAFSEGNKASFDKDFYKDIDRLKNRGCCTLPILIIFLFMVFAGLVGGLIVVKNYTHMGIDYLAKSKPLYQKDLQESLITQTKDMKPGETVNLSFTEMEMAEYLGIADPDFPLKKARLAIAEKGVIIKGKMSDSLLSLPVEFVVRPKVDQGKLTLVLDDIATSSVSMPKFARDKINAYLDLIMRSKNLYDPTLEIITAATVNQKLQLEIHRK